MARTSMFSLTDKAIGGGLEDRLRGSRRRGASFQEIALGLHDQGITISAETVRKWCHELGIEAQLIEERAS